MSETTKKHDWSKFLSFYGEQNKGRSTRLGVFENAAGAVDDYWLEDGLPLTGIDVDNRGAMPTIEIMLGDDFTHIVKAAKSLKIHFSLDGNEDGFDITDADGSTTVLRFEN